VGGSEAAAGDSVVSAAASADAWRADSVSCSAVALRGGGGWSVQAHCIVCGWWRSCTMSSRHTVSRRPSSLWDALWGGG
jgi:hypothetical protein